MNNYNNENNYNSGAMVSPSNLKKSAENMPYQIVYPEVYYKLQPYIMSVCDQMDTYGNIMPNEDMIRQLTDSIYDDVCRLYPDLTEYVRSHENNDYDTSLSVEAISPIRNPDGYGWRDPGYRYGRGFRRRGLFRDLIDILLLTEFFRRRRRPY